MGGIKQRSHLSLVLDIWTVVTLTHSNTHSPIVACSLSHLSVSELERETRLYEEDQGETSSPYCLSEGL